MLALVFLVLAGVHSSPSVLQQFKVFSQKSEGYETFRIPGLVQTSNGTLLAFAEGRVAIDRPAVGNASVCYGSPASKHDSSCVDKDIVYKRSYDAGATWTATVVLTEANATYFYSNPNAAVDPRTGRVYLLYARCAVAKVYGDCVDVVRESNNDGETFGDSRLYEDLPLGIGGPGGGWVVRRAMGKPWQGRVLFPKHGKSFLYSDNEGVDWKAGLTLESFGENEIAETSNGSLVMAIRSGYAPAFLRSDDGGAKWYRPDVITSLVNPNCQVSLTSFQTKSNVYLLLSHPNTNVEPQPLGRQNMTVHYSADMGTTWSVLVQIYEGSSAYSSVIQINETTAACFYERSESSPPINFESMYIAFIPFAR